MSALLEIDALACEVADLQRRLFALRRQLRSEQPPLADDGMLELLVCTLGEHRVAVPVESIDEVVLLCRLEPVPGAPAGVAGLLNVRGTSVPVVDARQRMFQAAVRPQLSDLILVCRVEGRRAGVLVDGVLELVRVESGQVQPVDADTPHAPFVLGSLVLADHPVWLLSAGRLLAVGEGSAA